MIKNDRNAFYALLVATDGRDGGKSGPGKAPVPLYAGAAAGPALPGRTRRTGAGNDAGGCGPRSLPLHVFGTRNVFGKSFPSALVLPAPLPLAPLREG